MKCLFKTIISLVVIIAIAAVLMYFWGIPTLINEENAAKHLEKADYTVEVATDAECETVSVVLGYDLKGQVEAANDGDIVSIWYFDDTDDAKKCKETQEKVIAEFYEELAKVAEVFNADRAESLRKEGEEIKTIRFGKTVIQGKIRGIIAAVTGF